MSKNLLNVATAFEPCDCGSHIRHNNGGNYHDEWYISYDKKTGQFLEMKATTCELVDYDNQPIINGNDGLQQALEDFQKTEEWGWKVSIDWELISQIKNINIEMIRRRTRDLLNKTAKREDILSCAVILGAKLF